MPTKDNKSLIPVTNDKLPAIHEVPEDERYSYPDFKKYSYHNFEYTVEDSYKDASKIKIWFIRFAYFLKELIILFIIMVSKELGFFTNLKSFIVETFNDIKEDFTSRKPIIKSTPFKHNLSLSIFSIFTLSILFAFLAAKTDSTSEYLKTFFFGLILCGIFIFFANLMNPLHISPRLYALLTSFLIITGIFLQVMYQKRLTYAGVAGIIKNMGIGLVLGLVACFAIIILCRTPYQKFARFIVISGTVIMATVSVILSLLGGTKNGAANWIEVFNTSIQITEIVKIMAVVAMSMIFSRKDISPQKIVFHNLILLAYIAVCFVIGNEIGTLLILGIAFLMLCFINLESMKLIVRLGVFACVLLFVASGYGKSSYDKLYDVSDRTAVIIESLYEEYSDSEKSCIINSQQNCETSGIDSDSTKSTVKNAITFTFKGDNEKESSALAETAAEFFNGDNINKDEHQIINSEIGKPAKQNDGNYELIIKYVYEKDIKDISTAARLGGKFYKKALERLGYEGDQTQANQIGVALHSTQWFGSEEKNIGYVAHMNTDTIFSYALMQLGVGGVIMLLAVYMLMFFTTLVSAYKSGDNMNASLIIGFSVCISIQSIIQLSIALKLFPIMGMVSAFLSSGGTANLINYAMTFFILYSMRLILPKKNTETDKEVL